MLAEPRHAVFRSGVHEPTVQRRAVKLPRFIRIIILFQQIPGLASPQAESWPPRWQGPFLAKAPRPLLYPAVMRRERGSLENRVVVVREAALRLVSK
jgi:hypothetical protein